MDLIVAIIIAIVAVIIIIALNAAFIYVPVRDIQRKVDTTITKIDQTVVKIDKAVVDIEQLSAFAIRIEPKVTQLIDVADCTFCQIFHDKCTNNVPNISEICPKTS